MRLRAVAAVSGLSLALTGCALTSTATPSPEPATAISGKVHGGQQPIAQAHIYLFAAGTSSYGGNGIPASSANASVSVLNSAETGGQSDSVGPYVLTNGSGEFTLPSYSCTAGTPVYLYALGGNPSGGTNSAAGLMAALGTCPVTTSFIEVNEITTVAAAYAFAGFASDATHVSTSGSTLAQTGIVNAFANASNLANVGSGAALATTPAGNGTVPMNEVLTLANILAYCVNSNDAQGAISANCSTLFGYARSGGTSGSPPTDTASAAINIAHNPGANVANLFPLGSGKVAYAISGNYEQPGDFTVQLRFSGGGLDSFKGIAIDAAGDAWVANFSANTVTELSPTGAFLSGASGYSGGSMSAPIEVAIDLSGNAWVANTDGAGQVVELSSTGVILSGANGYGSFVVPHAIAVDPSSNIWITSSGGIAKLSSSGTVLSTGYTGSTLGDGYSIAIDTSGNVWTPNPVPPGNLSELSSSGSILSGTGGYTGGGLDYPYSVAIDHGGNVWAVSLDTAAIAKFSSSGVPLSGTTGITGTGIGQGNDVAIDGAGNVWIAGGNAIAELSNTGAVLSGSNGFAYEIGGGSGIAVDGSGNVWTNKSGVTEYIGLAAPVVTPIAAGVANNSLGTRP